MKFFIILIIFVWICAGCASSNSSLHKVSHKRNQVLNKQSDDVTAVKSVVGAVSGKEVTDGDLYDLGAQLKKDKEVQTAIEAISESMVNPGEKVKYCPVTGKRYSSRLEICPIHNVLLKEVEP